MALEMEDHVHCPYCTDTPTGIQLLKHIFSKHEQNFFHKKNIEVLHSRYVKWTGAPGEFYFHPKDTQSYFCCFGCMKAVKKEPFARKHFPKCEAAFDAKVLELRAKYPADVSGVVVNQVTETKVTTTITTIVKFGDTTSMELLSKYHRDLEDAEKQRKTAVKKLERMKQWFIRNCKVSEDDLEDLEAEISDSSSVDEDPNDILQHTAKVNGVTLPKIKKVVDADGLVHLKV